MGELLKAVALLVSLIIPGIAVLALIAIIDMTNDVCLLIDHPMLKTMTLLIGENSYKVPSFPCLSFVAASAVVFFSFVYILTMYVNWIEYINCNYVRPDVDCQIIQNSNGRKHIILDGNSIIIDGNSIVASGNVSINGNEIMVNGKHIVIDGDDIIIDGVLLN